MTTDGTASADGFDMFARCVVEANVRAATWTADWLLESERETSAILARALIALYDAVDDAAEVVTTRSIERALSSAGTALDVAYHVIRGETAN